MDAHRLTIALIGPGGAGKTTVGALLAERLGIAFFDLDRQCEARVGDIGEYINRAGYHAYARENVDVYNAVVDGRNLCVAALSSGFMTYPQEINPDYARLRRSIEESRATFVLVPSLDREICVAEIVRRQLGRSFARSAAQEEAVIRSRFPIYVGLPARKIETMRPLPAIVDEIVAALGDERVLSDAHS